MSSATLACLLFGSGLAALVFETLWVKQVTLVVGVEMVAITTVVSAFFGGLAGGSAVLGAWADRQARPLRLYAGLEAGIALSAVAVTLALGHLAPVYVRAVGYVGAVAWVIPFTLVAAPAFLMGGTLPAVVRMLAPDGAHVASTSGFLYAANTAGGVAGALASVFLLVPALGVRGSAFAAAALNGLLALVALWAPAPIGVARAPRLLALPRAGLALVLYAGAGAVALGAEVVWSQAVVPFMNTRAYAFALVLATYLTGLVVGSAAYATVAPRVRRPWIAFGLLELAVAVTTLTTFAALGPWLPRAQNALSDVVLAQTGSTAAAVGAHMLLAPLAVLFVPALFLGAAFPAAARLVCGPSHVGRDLGAVAAANMLGGIAGTALTGFVVLPALGLRGATVVLVGTAATVGAIALVQGASARARMGLGAGLAVVLLLAAGRAVPRDHLARLLVALHGGSIVAHDEGPGGSVTIIAEPFFNGTFNRLYIQGVSNSSDNLMARRYMRLQALLPLLVHHGEPRSALVVGLGTGTTCGALLAYPGLERRTCVELLPTVARNVRHFQGNYGVADDPRVDIRIADGRHDLLLRPERYDLITLEPPPPIAAGVVNLYSRDFYLLCHERLAPHGLMAQWLPLSTQNDDDSRMLVRAFLDAFPYAALWSTELHEMLLVGGRDPLVLDVPTVSARFAAPTVTAALAEVGVPDVATVLATWVTDRDGLVAYAGDAPSVTDDRPRIEYAGLTRPGEFGRALEHVLSVRRDPPLVGADAALEAQVRAARDRLLAFYRAGVLYYAGRRDDTAPLLERVLGEEPHNPYYRWFVGG